MNIKEEIWIGLIEIKPFLSNSIISQNERAYTNGLVYAISEEDYKNKITLFLLQIKFHVIDIEDAEPLSSRMINFEVDNSIIILSKLLEVNKTPQISTLHVFEE
ncbi:MAG: hypothetical protein E6767_08910 [Dysgonomonas sp.]|nr:hypothetical protein [Dysgonomonas sp.]